MSADAHNTAPSTERLRLLLAAVPPRGLYDFIRGDATLTRHVFRGFSAREKSLDHPIVRQQLERELLKRPEVVEELHAYWLQVFADLLELLNNPHFAPTAEVLHLQMLEYGQPALHYALLQSAREEVAAWAERLEEIRQAQPLGDMLPGGAQPHLDLCTPDEPCELVRELRQAHADLQTMLQELQRTLRDRDQEIAELKREVAFRDKQLELASAQADLQLKQHATLTREYEREQRRRKKAEDEAERLDQQHRQLARQLAAQAEAGAAPAALTGDAAAVITKAIELLMQGLTLTQPTASADKPAAPPAKTEPAPLATPAAPAVKKLPPAGPKSGKGFTASQVATALLRNDLALLTKVREHLSRLGKQPGQERALLKQLAEAGIPEAVLVGPLRPAVVDGSNIANMSPSKRARLAYLEQVRRSAWEESYFPVIIIVDASLRYQIDQADQLMAMVERGEVQMAPPGTQADELLIKEAERLNAILLTNDRMTNWPEAKAIEKRHVELQRGAARVGSFHRSAAIFSW